MALPINIEDLLRKNRVETTRIEYKAGWNPDDIFHTVCAFATDLEDLGGGYVVIGVEQDDNGVAIRPVKGVPLQEIDKIMKEIVRYESKISPRYLTKSSIEKVDGKNIIVIWTPAGLNRPYSVPEYVTVKKSIPKYYVRSKSSTIEARGTILEEVRDLANKVPFDERGNESATIEDLSSLLVYDHLKTIDSKLAENFSSRPLVEILEEMDLLTGPIEDRKIKNCAVMMFCEHSYKFFPVTQVDIVIFPDGCEENPDVMIEVPKITGTVPKMIKETLSYLRTNVIKQKIVKPTDNEISKKVFNYPYQAFEEAVVNALYHRNYEEREPVEITIEPDKVEILSHSGPDRSISDKALKEAKRLKTRKYRNRRLGDFLKELDLTEGRATGIPTIQKALKTNGSDFATIDTDEERSYFLMTIPCHEDFKNKPFDNVNQLNKGVGKELERILGQRFVQVQEIVNQSNIERKEQLVQILIQMFVQVWKKGKGDIDIERMVNETIDTLCLLRNSPLSANNINKALEFSTLHELKRKIINPLIQMDYISMTEPDKPTSAKQAYQLTQKGKDLF